MSGKSRKSGKKNSQKTLGDVTLNDFANASVCKNRLKKSVNSVSSVMQEIDERSWDEKIEDFDGDFDFVEEENEDGSKSVVLKKQETRRRKKIIEVYEEEQDGVDYPLDIWFLISEHIRPEDIGRFAAICKTSFAVVCSAKFWFMLYRRYYRNVPNLPERLQPECMVRLYGLRSCVIRALHYFYTPFIKNSKSLVTFEEHPQSLLKRQCTLTWHQKTKDKWVYYFKLKEQAPSERVGGGRNYSNSRQPDLIEMLEDVSANTEENCRVLQVTCPHFVPVPPVMGLHLSTVSLALSQGFASYRLTLRFASAVNASCGHRPLDAATCPQIILDPVINASVFDWWQPRYPHSSSLAIPAALE